jgi:hypothetical protein
MNNLLTEYDFDRRALTGIVQRGRLLVAVQEFIIIVPKDNGCQEATMRRE